MERKSIYIAPFIVRIVSRRSDMDHNSFTCKLHHACLSFVSVYQMAPPLTEVADIQLLVLSIYRPRRDERLSWPGWLTYSGQCTHINGHQWLLSDVMQLLHFFVQCWTHSSVSLLLLEILRVLQPYWLTFAIIILPFPHMVAGYCDEHVCVSGCLSIHSLISKTMIKIPPNFLYVLPVAITRSSTDDSAIRYVLLVLGMTSCFHVEFTRWQHWRRQSCHLQLHACLIAVLLCLFEAGDPWTVTADDRMKYDAQFYQLQPVAGFLTGIFFWFLILTCLQFSLCFLCIFSYSLLAGTTFLLNEIEEASGH